MYQNTRGKKGGHQIEKDGETYREMWKPLKMMMMMGPELMQPWPWKKTYQGSPVKKKKTHLARMQGRRDLFRFDHQKESCFIHVPIQRKREREREREREAATMISQRPNKTGGCISCTERERERGGRGVTVAPALPNCKNRQRQQHTHKSTGKTKGRCFLMKFPFVHFLVLGRGLHV